MSKHTTPLSASYKEWQASLWGACFIAFGLGALVANYFSDLIIWIVIIAGIILHGWGMRQINQRNNR